MGLPEHMLEEWLGFQSRMRRRAFQVMLTARADRHERAHTLRNAEIGSVLDSPVSHMMALGWRAYISFSWPPFEWSHDKQLTPPCAHVTFVSVSLH